jgi:hypothetical protein
MSAAPASLPDTYHRLVRLCSSLNVDITEGNTPRTEYRYRAADLVADPAAVAAVVRGEADRLAALHGARPRADVAASRFLHHYLWSVGLLFTGPWCLARRIPRIPLEAVGVRVRTGALRLDTTAVTEAPRTGAGAGPAGLRAAVADHVGPVLTAFGPHLRRGSRALWGMATDDLASGLWLLGRALGDEQRGIREATDLLPGATPPFPGAAAFRTLRAPSGRAHPTRTRLSCCLHYTLAPTTPCLTCPRLPDPDRLHRLESA